MSLREGISVDVVRAECLGRNRLKITFSDGHASTVDFGPFLRSSLNPETRRFLDAEMFRTFTVTDGNLVWGDYEMCFPVEDIYEGRICEGGSSGVSAGSGGAGLRKSGSLLAVAESKVEYITKRKK